MLVYLTKFLIKSSLFVCLLSFFFISPCYPVYKSALLLLLLLLLILPPSLLSIFLSLKKLTLSLLLPLLLVCSCPSWYYQYYYIRPLLFPFLNVAIVIQLTFLLLAL